jgi:ABC-type dipeptide/oligopeptide/nickel transport system permease subunit
MRGSKIPVALRAALPLVALVGFSWSVIATASVPAGRLNLAQAWAKPSVSHWLGCADGGLDVAHFLCFAIGYVLILAIVVALLGAITGTCLGAWASYLGGSVERVMLRACDLVQAFPNFLLALAVLAAVERPRRWHIGAVFVMTAWASFARLTSMMSHKLLSADFVMAAKAFGASRTRILVQHVIPNILGPIAVQVGTVAAGVVLSESALSFVGLGPSDGVSLGVLIEQGAAGMLRAPHVLVFSALALAAASGACQLAAEGLRQWVHRV